MICQVCQQDFPESEIEESHDVPVYMFDGTTRAERKNQADKWGRHLLCKKCHDIYEKMVFSIMINSLSSMQRNELKLIAHSFAADYFKKEEIRYDSAKT